MTELWTQRAREAARARRDGVRAAADRPSQRRAGEDPAPRAFVRASAAVQVRAAVEGEGLTFEGLASVTGRSYEMWDMFGPYDEVVKVGAFAETLAQPGLDVPLVIGHDQIRRMARTTNGTLVLSEVTDGEATGLHVLADLDPTDVDVAYIVPKLRSGLMDEMSFAFRIDSGRWSEDFTSYTIAQVDLSRGDVAIVGFGANPYASGTVRTTNSQAERLRLARLGMARAWL